MTYCGMVGVVKEQESRSKLPLKEEDYLERTPEGRTKKFLEENLQYPVASFDALLLWMCWITWSRQWRSRQ